MISYLFGQEYKKKKKDYMCILLVLDQKEKKKKKPVIIKDYDKGTKMLVKTKTKS